MARLRVALRSGTLTAGIDDTETTLASAEFADLPVVASPDVLVLILDPDGTNEAVYVTAHTASSTSVTVTRGMETAGGHGAAAAHANGIDWIHAPTPLDYVPASVDYFTVEPTMISDGLLDGVPAGVTLYAAAQTDPADDGRYVSNGTTMVRVDDLPSHGPLASFAEITLSGAVGGPFTWNWYASPGIWDKVGGSSGYFPGGTDVAVSDGGTGSSTAAGARTNLGIDSSLSFSNADYTIATTALRTIVRQTGTLSALRVVTLPAANAVPAGAVVSVNAGAGCSPRYALSIVPAGSDTVNGSALSTYIAVEYGGQEFVSNGADAWIINTLPPGGFLSTSFPGDPYIGPLYTPGLSVTAGTLSSLLSNVLGRVYFCPIPVFRPERCDAIVCYQSTAGSDSGLTGELQLAIPGTWPGRVDAGISGGDYDATAAAGLRVVSFGGTKVIRPGLRWGVFKVRCSTSAGTNPQWYRTAAGEAGVPFQIGEAPTTTPLTQAYYSGATSTAAMPTDLGSLTWVPSASNSTPWVGLRRA